MKRLTEKERERTEENISTLEELGTAVGNWGWKSLQCHRKSFTITVTFDNEVDVFEAQRFAEVMIKAPALFLPTLRRLVEFDEALSTEGQPA